MVDVPAHSTIHVDNVGTVHNLVKKAINKAS